MGGKPRRLRSDSADKVWKYYGTKKYNDPCGCSGWIKFGSDKIKVVSAGSLYASNEGVFPMKEGDVVIVSIPTGARGVPPSYRVILVNNNLFVDLSSEDFTTEDWTFKPTRKGNDLLFDLGFKNGKRKTAVYRTVCFMLAQILWAHPLLCPRSGVRPF